MYIYILLYVQNTIIPVKQSNDPVLMSPRNPAGCILDPWAFGPIC